MVGLTLSDICNWVKWIKTKLTTELERAQKGKKGSDYNSKHTSQFFWTSFIIQMSNKWKIWLCCFWCLLQVCLCNFFSCSRWTEEAGQSPAGHGFVWYAPWLLRAVCAAACQENRLHTCGLSAQPCLLWHLGCCLLQQHIFHLHYPTHPPAHHLLPHPILLYVSRGLEGSQCFIFNFLSFLPF